MAVEYPHEQSHHCSIGRSYSADRLRGIRTPIAAVPDVTDYVSPQPRSTRRMKMLSPESYDAAIAEAEARGMAKVRQAVLEATVRLYEVGNRLRANAPLSFVEQLELSNTVNDTLGEYEKVVYDQDRINDAIRDELQPHDPDDLLVIRRSDLECLQRMAEDVIAAVQRIEQRAGG